MRDLKPYRAVLDPRLDAAPNVANEPRFERVE